MSQPPVRVSSGFIGIVIAMLLLIAYSFSSAQWTSPSANPPENNVPAPINVGTLTQAKAGNLGANILAASSSVWSDMYCDGDGDNCVAHDLLGSGSGGGNEVVWLPTGRVVFSMPLSTMRSFSRTTSLVDAGYPSNIIRVLLDTSWVGNYTCTSFGGGGGDPGPTTCSGEPGVVNLRQSTANVTYDNPLVRFSWVTINSPNLVFNASARAATSTLLAYECTGPCLSGTQIGTCQVATSWNIGGETGRKTVTMNKNQANYLVMEYKGRSGNLPGLSQQFDEILASRSWNRGWCNSSRSSHVGIVGYMNPDSFSRYKAAFDATTRANYVALPMIVGTSRTLRSLIVSGSCQLPADTVTLSATVVSCTN